MVVIVPKETQTDWFIIGRDYTIGWQGGQEAILTNWENKCTNRGRIVGPESYNVGHRYHAMLTICLLHWNEAEAAERLERLRAVGFAAYHSTLAGPPLLHQLRENPPAAIVIDLTRLPSHGREVGAALRATKATRFIPLVFVDSEAEKVARVRALLPDAVYTSWDEIGPALQTALSQPLSNPVAIASSMDAYAGQTLPKKLGIKSKMKIALVNAPPGFSQLLDPIPDEVQFKDDFAEGCEMAIWFVRSQSDLAQAVHIASGLSTLHSLWFAWPKKASGLPTDLTQQVVRETGLANDWVDYKICSIDQTWSGLLFARRKG
jgi:CheY-like chemotaxis protein